VKARGLDMERLFLFLLLDFNDRVKKVLSESVDVVHLFSTSEIDDKEGLS
jgi:hypothetical protein